MHNATLENETESEGNNPKFGPTMSMPEVEPVPDVVNRFWKRVAEVTARYHGIERKWIGSEELKAWTETHRSSCQKCTGDKTKRQCIIDEEHPSCRTCRSAKIGCDRKPQFVFDMTEDQFFPTYDQFMKVYQNRAPGRLRRFRLLNSAVRKAVELVSALPKESSIVCQTGKSAYDASRNLREELQLLKISHRDSDIYHSSNYYRICVHLQNVDKLTRNIASGIFSGVPVERMLEIVQQINIEVEVAYSLATKHVRVTE
ncbi:hypothetical protein MVEN_02607400 [Mycena venus]|uniref:Zn(2)-C6 fungal-type domain-containing protein n=1 Tax=Mycena venus TaxID=2733690 RepID=A0A8H6TYP7_9AGAR|nr:hypothetical protein MVEN_02607400 [Mycena venus]